MKLTILMTLLCATSCAVDLATNEATTTQDFNDCNPLTCGGGGGGGGGGAGMCSSINCSSDTQCQLACGSWDAVCVIIVNFPYQTGSCWP